MTILQKVIGAFADAFSWFQEHLADQDVVNAIYEDLGVDPKEVGETPKLPEGSLDSIAKYRDAANPTPEAFLEAFDDVIAVIEALANIKGKNGNIDESLAHGVLGLLVTNYARFNFPKLYWFAEPVFFLEGLATSDPIVKGNTVAFTNGLKKVGALTLDSFSRSPLTTGKKIKDFIGALDEHFPLKTEADAKRLADFILLPLAIGLAIFEKGLLEKQTESPTPFGKREAVLIADSIYGWDGPVVSTTPVADRIADRTLTFSLIGIKEETADAGELKGAINCTMTWVPREHGGPGLLFAIGGSGQVESELGNGWKLVVKISSASAVDFLIRKPPLVNGPMDASASFTVEKPLTESGLPNFFPDRKGTRLEFERLAFSGEITACGAVIKVLAQNSALVLVNKDGDGFLKEILPAGETRINFDLGLGLSSERGFYVEGGTGLEVVIPIGKKLGPATVHQLLLSLAATTEAKPAHITTEVSLGLGAKIGPVEASVDRVGFQMRLALPQKGKPDFSVGFKPPKGVGLSIDATGVTGGGFLTFDPAKGQYSGVLQLNLEGGIAVKAIGLLDTHLPENKKGFSLLIIITVENFELQLGLGFRLTGIGGLLALNRTFDQKALRSGLKNHTLDSVMFPKDPIRNAPQLLSNLNKVFPPAKGRHLFGPMVQIKWAELITMNLALILEIEGKTPKRLLVLGQVTAILPKKEHDLIRLQLDAIGVIDFDQGTASLDAALYDSRLANKFVLTGDMAMRLRWESSRNFALAVGGLHPAFNPPPNFPKLERITINLTAGDNPRLRCEAYFAITSNTLQFGARAELYASAHGFSIHGELGFDVLIQLDPFAFVADFRAQVQLKRGSTNLFKVKVEGELTGPRPLHIKGKATFEIFWWDISIRFDKTLIGGAKPPRPEPVEVLPLLKEALGNSANWVGVLPNGLRQVATLRQRLAAVNEVLLHPLGTLTVKQTVVPLNTSISRFGPAVPAGARLFRISSVSLGGSDESPQTVTDFFAPAQFNEMSDDQKLSSPSFEPMAAGVSFGSDEFSFPPEKVGGDANWLEAKTIEFETIIIDKERNETRSDRGNQSKPKYQLHPELFAKQFRFGAAGTSDLRRSGRDKYRGATGKYKVTKEGWSIVATGDLSVQPVAGVEAGKTATYSEAVEALRGIKRQDLTKASGLKVMRLSELK